MASGHGETPGEVAIQDVTQFLEAMPENIAARTEVRAPHWVSGDASHVAPAQAAQAAASVVSAPSPDGDVIAQWTLPVRKWAYRQARPDATSAAVPKADTGIADPMLRRRLSPLARLALSAGVACGPLPAHTRVVYASQHGEILRTTQMLESLVRGEPPSPTAFSLSVLNATPGVLSMARNDMSPVNALSSGDDTLGYALLDAWTQHRQTPSESLLVIYAFEAPPACYGPSAHQLDDTPSALALLIDADAAARLTCRLCPPQSSVSPDAARSALPQHESLVHVLSGSGAADWHGERHAWHWSWQDADA